MFRTSRQSALQIGQRGIHAVPGVLHAVDGKFAFREVFPIGGSDLQIVDLLVGQRRQLVPQEQKPRDQRFNGFVSFGVHAFALPFCSIRR